MGEARAAPAVGFLGVGRMGRPMVDRLVAAGVPTEAYVRRAEHRTELVDAGVVIGESPSDVASRADLVIVCFFDDAQVREVVLGDGVLAAMRPGSVLASHVTGSPDLAEELQATAPVGVTVLDAPISGTDDHIRRGELTILVGGDADAVERGRSAFETYADPILHVGRLGDGQRVKLINNLLFAANLRAAIDAVRLAGSVGVDARDLARLVGECSGSSFALDQFRDAEPDRLAAGAKRYLIKDVDVIREVARQAGIELGDLGELAGWVYDR